MSLMNLQKQQNHITTLYQRGDIDGAKEGFEELITYLEETDQMDFLEYGEALLGLGSLYQNDLDDRASAEDCWQKLASAVNNAEEALAMEPEYFDVYTQALLLLALVQNDLGKIAPAKKNLELLREIAVEVRGEQSPDVVAIDDHLKSLKRQ
jgi:tetratricopeptide (TPR) repeat protein